MPSLNFLIFLRQPLNGHTTAWPNGQTGRETGPALEKGATAALRVRRSQLVEKIDPPALEKGAVVTRRAWRIGSGQPVRDNARRPFAFAVCVVLAAAVLATVVFAFTTPASAQNLAELNSPPKVTAKNEAAGPELSLEEIRLMAESPASPGQAMYSPESSSYTLGPNDVIEIAVMRHPEVSGQFPINAEGKIQYSFVGDVVVSGLTKEQAKEVIANRLAEYIINPEVTVTVIGYNSKIVYVVGEVGAPGKIYMRGDTMTAREALVQAGLPLLSGTLRKSWLITPSETKKGEKKEIDGYALMFEGDLRQNFTMKPGDVLFIPPTMLTKALRAITPVTRPVAEVRSAVPVTP